MKGCHRGKKSLTPGKLKIGLKSLDSMFPEGKERAPLHQYANNG
jgi:hypothetical protein